MAQSRGGELKPFVSAHSTARRAVIMTYIWIAIAIALIPVQLMQLDDGLETSDSLDFAILSYALFALVEFTAIIAAFILFFLWFYRTYRNLPSLGATELQFSPRRAIIYFFVPILCLWKPYDAAKEIWNVSVSGPGISSKLSRSQMDKPRIVILWWAFWIISNIVGWAILRRGFSDESLANVWLYIGSDILDIISGFLTIRLIQQIDRMQATKNALIRKYIPPSDPLLSQNAGNDTGLGGAEGQDFASQKPG